MCYSFRLMSDPFGRGIRVEFLPPYSPHLNPIELMFSAMKSFFQRNHYLVQQYWAESATSDDAKRLLRAIALEVGSPENVKGWFKKCRMF